MSGRKDTVSNLGRSSGLGIVPKEITWVLEDPGAGGRTTGEISSHPGKAFHKGLLSGGEPKGAVTKSKEKRSALSVGSREPLSPAGCALSPAGDTGCFLSSEAFLGPQNRA